MKLRLCLLLLLLLLPLSAFAAVSYDLDLQLDPARHQLSGRVLLDFHGVPPAPLQLQLSPQCEIIAVRQGQQALPYRFSAGQLQLDPVDAQPVSIYYQGVFNDPVSDTSAHDEDPGYGISASISDAGTYLSSGASWYPRLQNEEISYRIRVSAPSGIEAVTSGLRTSHEIVDGRSRSTWQIDYPVRGLSLAAGAFQLSEEKSGAIPIYAYFSAANTPLAASYLRAARSYLQLYEELFGPYPFGKFAIVENFFPTGYGLPSWTLLGSSVIRLPFIIETSLGHEIAHSWWGVGVRVDYARGNWSEGLTTYVADYLYKERSSATEGKEYRQTILRDYANLVTPENAFAVNAFSSRHDKASQVIGYGKVAMIFHMLRKQIGDDAFWRGLRQLAQERMHTEVSWDDFRTLFEKRSGQDLGDFFSQWLTRTEGPQLSLQNVKQEQTDNGWRVSGQLTQGQPIYQLAVDLELTTAGEALQQTVRLNEASAPFSFETSQRPLSLQADPQADLFRILDPAELPATINSIRGSDQLLVVTADSYTPDLEAITTLLGGMRKAELPIRKFSEVSPADLASHDLLIFGLPNGLKPEQLKSEADDQFTLEDQPLDPKSQSAFVVEKNPLNAEHRAAWFVSEDAQAAVVARKIPHYGKYSYLLFDGVENRLKGVRTPRESGLRVELNYL